MADIQQFIRKIQIAARGEEVRQSLVDALKGINQSIPFSVSEALAEAKASGEFNGNDGLSPEITVVPIAGGHRVIISDADHPSGHSFDVMNGNGAGDMKGSTYDPDSAVALAGGIAAYLASNMQGVMRSGSYDPSSEVSRSGGIVSYLTANMQGVMRSGTYDPDNVVARAGGIAEYVAENAQEAMSFDNAPYPYSTNPVTSRGIYLAIQNLVYEIAEIKGRLSSLENRVAALEAGGTSGTGTGGATVDEDDLLLLRGAVVEDDYLVLDGTGANEDDGIIEFGRASSYAGSSGTSVSENIMSLSGTAISDSMLVQNNGSVEDNILEL